MIDWAEIIESVADTCGNRPGRETYIAVGQAKKKAIALIGLDGFLLTQAICLAELYRKASNDDEEHILAEDLLERLDSTVDQASSMA